MEAPPPTTEKHNSLPAALRRRWPALVILAVALLFFWQYFVLDVTLYGGDTAFVMLPFRHYVTERLSRGQLPLWNPHLFAGTPALAEAQYQVLYLPNLLLFLFGVDRGMGWTLPLHMALMAAGMYLFGRRALGLGRPAALVAALALAFGGCVQSRLAVSVYTQAAAWAPWVLLGYDTARRRGGWAYALPGAGVAMQLFTGAPQYGYYTLALLLAYHLYRSLELRQTPAAGEGAQRRAWTAFGATLVLGALLSAVQVLPELELALQSDRGTRTSFDYATEFSLVGRHLVALLFPKFWGSFSAMPLDNFYPGEEQGYLGVVTLGLLAAGLLAGRCRGQSMFWGIIAVLSILLALGRNNPAYAFLYDWVPGFATFRAPARWLLVTSFAGAVLAGFGLDAILAGSARAVKSAAFTMIALAIVGVVLLAGPWGAPAFLTPNALYGPWGQVILVVAAAGLFGALAFAPAPAAQRARAWTPRVVLALLVVDLFVLSLDMEQQHTRFVEKLSERPETVKRLLTDTPGERFWSGHEQVPMEIWQVPNAPVGMHPMEFRERSAATVSALMPSCIAAQYGTNGLTGAWGALMPLRRHARPIYKPETPGEIQLRWLRLLNVRSHLALRPLQVPTLEQLTSEPPYVYRDPQALPRSFFVAGSRPSTGDDAVDIISSAAFDPRQEALVEGGETTAAPAGSSLFTPARLVETRPERVEVEVDAPSDGNLVVMDTFYPGWKAMVDGRPVEIRPANWMGRAVPVTKGTHRVEMRFAPASFRVGLFITLASLAGCLAFAFAASGSRRRR